MTAKDTKKKPLEPRSDNPSENDRLHTATENQSAVGPEDYPAAEREGQTSVVGKPRAKPAQGATPRGSHG